MNVSEQASLSLDGVNVQGNFVIGVQYAGSGNLTFVSSGFANTCGQAALASSGIGNVSLTSTSFTSSVSIIAVETSGGAPKVKMRGCTLLAPNGVMLQDFANAGSVYDLGTPSDAGNNSFETPTTGTGLYVAGTNITVNASGNTWRPSFEGTDAAGHYPLNTVYNGMAQSAAEYVPQMKALGLRHFRVELLRETGDAARAMLDRYARVISGQDDGRAAWRQLKVLNQLGVTRGTLDE